MSVVLFLKHHLWVKNGELSHMLASYAHRNWCNDFLTIVTGSFLAPPHLSISSPAKIDFFLFSGSCCIKKKRAFKTMSLLAQWDIEIQLFKGDIWVCKETKKNIPAQMYACSISVMLQLSTASSMFENWVITWLLIAHFSVCSEQRAVTVSHRSAPPVLIVRGGHSWLQLLAGCWEAEPAVNQAAG